MANDRRPLCDRLSAAPLSASDALTDDLLDELLSPGDDTQPTEHLGRPEVKSLVRGLLCGSPYLTGLMRRDPGLLHSLLASSPEDRLDELCAQLKEGAGSTSDITTLMAQLRRFKSEAALLIALCDLGGIWPIMDVTRALTRIADCAVACSVSFLFRHLQEKGNWLVQDLEDPAASSGYFVLAMGKHGACELNYSSDIDLIVFYDPTKAQIKDRSEVQSFFVRLTRDLVKCLNERTVEGYVFRTDLRLRPDPGATQAAMSIDSALHYYESFGQNWERAAMIKARPIAGDITAGDAFLQELTPFIWRKYLDYAAIADVHAMKRQIHVHRGFSEIAVAGHNIKLGRGGIREIEFFVQTQQLIAGGRQPDLRSRQTLVSLERLAERGWIKPETRDDLDAAYRFLRWLEHRIQMVADEQTHQLPAQPEQLEIFARFCGYETTAIFEVEVRRRLEIVQRHYSALFEDLPQLSMASANLVFAGEDDDPETVTALSSMGFQRPSQVIGIVRAWHRGRYPAVASEKSRERLTEVQPLLIEALSDTVDPDAALIGFDRFLSKLPTGIALFALLKAQPEMMTLLATIAGSAPRLADILSRRRRVFDAVLDPRIIGAAPEPNEIATIVADELGGADSYEEVLDRARIIGGEQMFLVGARILSGVLSATRAGEIYALIAEELIRALHAAAEADFSIRHGTVQDGAMGVIAMGKLGGWEMTASSDLDLITVYDFDPDCKVSDGRSPLSVNEYYARLTQRLISALSAPTTQGLLYDVDLRLRPSGQKGPVATQLSGFIDYQTNQAWTWEHLALTRARVLSGPPELRRRIEGAIRSALMIPRDRAKIATDVRDMRARIEGEKGTDNIWDMKQVRGGLVDIEFACQFLQLVYAAEQPQILDQNTQQALKNLRDAGYLSAAATSVLLDTHSLIQDLGQVTRLCFEGPFDPHKAPDGLKQLLAIVGNEPTFSQLEARLRQALDDSAATFEDIMN